ncbi:unnamed protein product, partial [Ranitomeya imitator]
STATNTLLHATSSHHPQTFRSVPISQFLRIKRICSDDDTFEQQARILKSNLQQRGYNHRAIRAGYRRAKFTPREILLAQSRHNMSRTRSDNQPVRFITTFNSEWRVISDILRKYWPVLLADEDVEPHISQYPSITWRRSRNLKDLLTRSHYVAPHRPVFSETAGPKWGSFQCGGCSACKIMERTFSFENSDSTKTFSITHHINCKTENVVYYAKCGCGLIYIGMTTRELRVRVLEHVRDIRNGALAVDIDTLKTVPKHFRLHHNSNPKWFKVREIDRVQLGIRGGNYKKELLKRETRWMVDLDTVAPKGLNEYDIEDFLDRTEASLLVTEGAKSVREPPKADEWKHVTKRSKKTMEKSPTTQLKNRYQIFVEDEDGTPKNEAIPASKKEKGTQQQVTAKSTAKKQRRVVVVGDSLLRGTEAAICRLDITAREVCCLPGAMIKDVTDRIPKLFSSKDVHPFLLIHVGTNDTARKDLPTICKDFEELGRK